MINEYKEMLNQIWKLALYLPEINPKITGK
jgi:hypothetical protein